MSHRWGVSFEHWAVLHDKSLALIWSVIDELVHEQDCTTSYFHAARFGNKSCCSPLESAPRAGIARERKNPSVWLYLGQCTLLRANFLCAEAGNNIMTLRTETSYE